MIGDVGVECPGCERTVPVDFVGDQPHIPEHSRFRLSSLDEQMVKKGLMEFPFCAYGGDVIHLIEPARA